jgi:uncharacterized protein YdeI (YjbR/CyaY-like superfamily)
LRGEATLTEPCKSVNSTALMATGIHMAKRPETRERRIRESIELLSAGKKLGLK